MSQYLCEDCGTIFEKYHKYEMSEWNYCNLAGCNGNIIELDDNMIFVIKMLNEKGYPTKYCCGGHATDKCNNIYIMFDEECFDGDFSMMKIPDGFKVYDVNGFSLRCEKDMRETGLNKQLLINEMNSNLIKWVVDLEDLSEYY